MYRKNFHVDDKHGAAPGQIRTSYVVTKADVGSFSQTPARLTEGHLTSEAALGLSCLCCLFLGLSLPPLQT